MQVRLKDGQIVEAYPAISSMDDLLVKYSDEKVIQQKGKRWDYVKPGEYEIIEENACLEK